MLPKHIVMEKVYLSKTTKLALLSCFLFTTHCHYKKPSTDVLDMFTNKIPLSDSLYIDFSQIPGGGYGIDFLDSMIIMSDLHDENYYQLVDMNDKKLIKKFGKSGRGPGEAPYPPIIISQSWRHGKLKTIQPNRIYSYSIDSLLNFESYLPNPLRLKDTPFFMRATEIRPGTIIGLGLFEDGMYGVIRDGEFIGSFLDYPIKEQYKNIDRGLLGIAYQGLIQSHPEGEKFVAAFLDGGIIQFIDMKKEPMIFKEIITALPDLKPLSSGGGQSLAVSRDTQQGYSGLATTRDYVYAVYSGKTDKDSPYSAAMSVYGNHLLVFDWNGAPVIHFTLDHGIISLFVDQDNQYAYGSNSMGDIVRFPLLMNSRLK